MPRTRQLLNGEITYSAAKEKETNVLHSLNYCEQRTRFWGYLDQNRHLIKAVVLHHLGHNSPEECHIADQKDWINGTFNLCIPITLRGFEGAPNRRLMIRFPLPYRVGEDFCPGNTDEKLRCEAGTYAWLQENCPQIPIPCLYGFGLSTGEQYTALESLPFTTRMFQYLRRRFLAWIGWPTPSRYIPHRMRDSLLEKLHIGYLLIEYIDEDRGEMLSKTWDQNFHRRSLRKNLFRGLSKILLAVARVPLPHIGSFVIDADGFLSLTNRPLTLEIHELENEHIPVDIPREVTYSTVDSYVHDILSFHDSRLRHQPNAVNDFEDCIFQMSALTIMRSVSSLFFRPELRRGPFFLNFTDLDQSNIFVDQEWNIKCLVDLEWSCSRPVEMMHPPYWLTNQSVDGIDQNDYEKVHGEFMELFKEEEQMFCPQTGISLSQRLEHGWRTGTFWYSLALDSPTGIFTLFYEHIQPRFEKRHIDDPAFFTIMQSYWCMNAANFIRAKVQDKSIYDERLRAEFEDSSCHQGKRMFQHTPAVCPK